MSEGIEEKYKEFNGILVRQRQMSHQLSDRVMYPYSTTNGRARSDSVLNIIDGFMLRLALATDSKYSAILASGPLFAHTGLNTTNLNRLDVSPQRVQDMVRMAFCDYWVDRINFKQNWIHDIESLDPDGTIYLSKARARKENEFRVAA